MIDRLAVLLILLIHPILLPLALHAQPTYSPKIAEKSQDGEMAIHTFKLPGGIRAELFAAEPMVANPVAFCFDERGRMFVAETFRQQKGVEDNRSHMNWLLDDLSAQTVADRVAYFKKNLKDEIRSYTLEHDRIRLLEDTDGDGQADKATVFADGFNAIEDGTGAGVLALNGDVFYACIPKLWRLKDTNGDGVADERTALYDGFGVRVAFRGHDMHGLILGPDGRIYFSIGDRGYNVELKDKTRLVQPDQGAVFRCEFDGSNLEVFCKGLRNPQELAFDEFGNLFTGDNNSDSGDQARWTYLTEGSDTGWRMYFQYLDDRGPWNREKLWHVQHPGQAAYIVPPIAHFANGPSGLAYYPGTGLDEKYRGHFFLADFRGQASNSGIRSFSLAPKGASFEQVNAEEFVWSILATDVDFGYDGAIYVSDWVDGWDGSGKGRIYRFLDEKHGRSPIVKQVGDLMKAGFDARPPKELASLLAHTDYRIRLRAQLALAKMTASTELVAVAESGKSLVQRVHAIWGLGQLGRKSPAELKPLLRLFEDQEPEIRAQIARVCGDAGFDDAAERLTKLVKDPSPRVRALSAIAIGKLKYKKAFAPLLEAIAENGNNDPTLRHALVMGLVGTASPEELIATTRIPLPAVRIAAVVALRRMAHPGLTAFLNDSDPLVVLEAVRAIHDLPIPEALGAVAKLVSQPGLSDPVQRRALSANYRLGTIDCARSVAAFACNPLADEHLRLEGLTELTIWNSPSPLDRVTNEYRPLPNRDIDFAEVARPWLGILFAGSTQIRSAGAILAASYKLAEAEPYLAEIMKAPHNDLAPLRVTALRALDAIKGPRLKESVEFGLKDADPTVRSEARRVLAGTDPARAVTLLADAPNSPSPIEQQSAIASLAQLKRPDADVVLVGWLDKLLTGSASPAVQLDLLEAAKLRGSAELLAKVRDFDKTRKVDDHLREYRETLAGGDALRGLGIFVTRSDVSCRRCHKIQGSGGDVGPDLSRIGREKTREYLLESIVDPNKQIAKGFETAILQMANGKVYAGIVKQDTEKTLLLQQPDGQTILVDKVDVEDRAVGKSGMPDDTIKKLSKRDVRDLVEYLSTLQAAEDPTKHGPNTK